MNQTQQCLRPSGADFQQQWQLDALFVASAALYTQENLQQMLHLCWVSRVPGTLTATKTLLENMPEEAFNDSVISGYRIAACFREYGGVRQRWLVVESQARKDADLKQLETRLTKHLSTAQSELRQLSQQEFACSKDAVIAAERLSHKLPLHQLADIQVQEVKKHTGRGRPSKDACPTFYYQIDASLELKETALAVETKRAGRFILATNVIDVKELSDDHA